MLERIARGFFGGLWVFPGGALDPIDESELAREVVSIPDGADDLPWRSAALRETVEEVGFLLTDPPSGDAVGFNGPSLFEDLRSRGVTLDGRRLRLLSQWVTPEGAPTRFDARFYLAVATEDPVLIPQEREVTDVAWVRPQEALDRMDRGLWAMVTPTIHHLRWLAEHTEVGEIWSAAGRASVSRVEPIIEEDGSEVRVRLPAAAELP